jgi:hypothetical protein
MDLAILFNYELHVYSKVRVTVGIFHEDQGLLLAGIHTKLEQNQKCELRCYKTLTVFHFNARIISAFELELVLKNKLISLILFKLEF